MSDRSGRADGGRRRNLSAVLRLLHEGRAATRAELTRETGLNRSTVAALVAELEDLALVVEGEPLAARRVGRPSPEVRPHPDVVAIAVNPELDAVTVGAVGLGARVEARVRREVDRAVTPDEVAGIVSSILPELGLADRRVVGVGVAVPGLVRGDDGTVRWAPHLGWTDAALAPLLEHRLRLPVVVGNDASLGALAEHLFGAGRGADDVVYLNGGASGIGGGVIAGGRALRGTGGYAGEFGHNRPGLASTTDRRTREGVLEDEVNRALLLEAVGLTAADEPELEAALLGSEDPAVRDELARQRRVLAAALCNAVNVLNPELVVLGGFLATVLASDPRELGALVAENCVAAAGEGLRIRPAELGRDRLLIGAAELALAPLLADPTTPPLP